jgi:hypothetical protein
MKVQTFVGKVSIEGLHKMDDQINNWLKRNKITPITITQSFGSERHHDGRNAEPIVVTSIWYEPGEEDLL